MTPLAARGPAVAAFAAVLVVIAAGIGLLLAPGRHVLVGGLDASTPAWSPTGGHLAFLVHDSLGVHVAVYDFARRAHRVVGTTPAADATAFSWSPDGQRLAYTAPDITGDGRDVIEVYDVSTGASEVLAPASSPRWRGDGSIRAVCGPERPPFAEDSDEAQGAAAGAGEAEIRLCDIDVATGEVTRTSLAPEPVAGPAEPHSAVSPDGKLVAYEVLTGVKKPGGPGKREIWLMRHPGIAR